jgi:AcrR family transcriptional regulator
MEGVARRAGVGKASLYLRWSTKEALLAGPAQPLSARTGLIQTVCRGWLEPWRAW